MPGRGRRSYGPLSPWPRSRGRERVTKLLPERLNSRPRDPRKVGKQLRHAAAQKRAGGQIFTEAELASDQGLDELIGELPTHELDVQAAELVVALPADLQELAVLRLLGHSTKEIAEQLDCTQRKVQRKLELVRLKWENSLGET